MIDIKKQSFIKGAMILVIANAISKILGAVFKIPITYILDEEGMAIFNGAMQVYIMLLSIIISGIPMAISKLVAEQTALKNYDNVHKIVRVSEIMLAILGIVGSLILFFGADIFAYTIRDAKSALAIRVIAPSVFFVAIGVVYKSYYQGTQNMIPTALSQVIEAVIKLAAGYGFAIWLINYSIQTTSAGAIFGTTIGEIVATAILLLLYLPTKHRVRNISGTKQIMKTREIIKNIVVIALPLTLASGVGSVLSVIDISMIRTRLQDIEFTLQSAQNLLIQYSGFTDLFNDLPQVLHISEAGARWLYGAYSGYALTIFHLTPGIIGALGASILPVIAGEYAVGNFKKISYSIQLALRIVILIAMPCAVGMFILAEPILDILFKNTASAMMLKVISPCVVTVCLNMILVTVLQATGHIMLPFRNMIIGSICKLISIYLLIAIPEINILGAPLSTNIDYLVVVCLNLYAVGKLLKVRYNINSVFIKPMVCTVIMGTIVWLLYEPVNGMINNSVYAMILIIGAGAVAYFMSLIMTRAIEWHEIKGLFKRL